MLKSRLAALFLTAALTITNVHAYPKNFLWGTALSAHQTEGVTGGGEAGDWWKYEHSLVNGKSPISNGDTTERAVDHWNRYAEDFELARAMGTNTVRISIAWEKIEPRPGEFNKKAMQHYHDVLKAMHERGLRPMVALHHFTHPQWFHERGGWVSNESPKLFLRYATYVFKNLNDLCDLWITFNEPMVLVNMGYVTGEIPPNLQSQAAAVRVTDHLVRAHRNVTAMIHAQQISLPDDDKLHGVGFVHSMQVYDPADPKNKFDQIAADLVDELANWTFMKLALIDPKENTNEAKTNPISDWMGINYYTRFLISYKTMNLAPSTRPKGDNGWEIYPEGLERIVRATAKRIKMPMVVSENGIADGEDTRRPQVLKETLSYLDRLVLGVKNANGSWAYAPLDIRGYYHWSLTDNFEWRDGYRFKFGLIAIDYEQNLKRIPRPSAAIYRSEILSRF